MHNAVFDVGEISKLDTQDEAKISEIVDALKVVAVVEKSQSESESISFASAIEESDMDLTEDSDISSETFKIGVKKMCSLPQIPERSLQAEQPLKSASLKNNEAKLRSINNKLNGVEIISPLNPFTLTISCLLYEPGEEDIIENEIRYIYLNNILSDTEQLYLAKLRRYAKNNGVKFPHSIWLQALRFLSSTQFHVQTTLDAMKNNHSFRLNELPIHEQDVFDDLNQGAIYWHGRDCKYRPILIVKLARLDVFEGDIERIQRLLCFCLEFFLKYLQVAGRVENWDVIIDLYGKGITDLPIQVLKSVLSLVNTRYKMRLYRMFIVNCPKLINVVSSALLAAIPGSTTRKVRFIDEPFSDEMTDLISSEQLEVAYGGTCPDINENFYPFRFYPMNVEDTKFPNIYSVIPVEYIIGLSLEIPPKFDSGKIPWVKNLQNMNFTEDTARKLSTILGSKIRPVTNLDDILNTTSIKYKS
ncbi:hypothetical protein FG386_001207 [Cryptosporidium ryanae]|uniref:uncharacterized protein n=1 Tax=Cryptosporidium ryanae TaxID=515981 RepID=UPI003519D8A0|nr:hypothetical protein FG386_001207 [Cryptosporidium ryanae]